MKRLIFIHGRAQEDQDAVQLKQAWLGAWEKGLDKSGLRVPIGEDRVFFPYYGNTLRDLCEGIPPTQVANIIVRGSREQEGNDRLAALLREYLRAYNISDAEIERKLKELDPSNVKERGPQNWGWVQAALRAIDEKVPGAGAVIGLATNDVYQYLTKDTVSLRINDGVKSAFDQGDENVVVSHSLGTIVAYKLLEKMSKQQGWKVPNLITVGSPLGINSIREYLGSIEHPSCVGEWFNASDPHDVVALYPLDDDHFKVDPRIVDKRDVSNWTDNKHGIAGYLDDKDVAKRIYDAVV